MAKQTFTTGQVLTAAQMTSLQQTAMLGGDANARTASYVLAASDAGNAVSMNSSSATTITVNTGIFAAGDIVTIINLGTGVCTITAGTATVATAGSLALAQNEGGILRFTSASAAIFFEFATPQTGDITAVTTGANSGLTGGATSGAADLRINTSAKGSLMVGSGASTLAELTVGTNGHTLVADSSTSTGLKWAAASGGDFKKIAVTSFENVNTQNFNNTLGDYSSYIIYISQLSGTNADDLFFQFRTAGGNYAGTSRYWGARIRVNTASTLTSNWFTGNTIQLSDNIGNIYAWSGGVIKIARNYLGANLIANFNEGPNGSPYGINHIQAHVNLQAESDDISGFRLYTSGNNFAATVAIYGMVN